MHFLADMGQQGHDARHLRDEGLHRLANGEIFNKAATEERIVITFDLDFGEIVALSRGRVVSVVLFRLKNTTTSFVVRRLETVLSVAADALRSGAIVVVEDSRHRVRRLPLGS